MLYNELLLVGKRLQVPEGLIQYNIFAVHSGIGKDPKDKTRSCFRVSVSKDFEFTCHPEEYIDEHVLNNSYALQYRNGPKDTTGRPKYYFGDFIVKIKKSKPDCSLEKFTNDIRTPFEGTISVPDYMVKFKEAISKDSTITLLWEFILDRAAMLAIDKKISSIFIHFDLFEVLQIQNWHELPGCLETMDDLYLEYAKKEEIFKAGPGGEIFALTRSFLPMVATGDDSSDNQFLGFDLNNRYKSFCVNSKNIRTILYHNKIIRDLTLPIFRIDPYNFQLIPIGSYSPSELISFINRIKHVKANSFRKKEGDIADNLEVAEKDIASSDVAELFLRDTAVSLDQILDGTSDTITSFDLVLIRYDSRVIINVSEINCISKSFLLINLRRIDRIASDIRDKFKIKNKPSLANSFFGIHRLIGKGEKYHQKYIRFLLANIRGIYYGDKDIVRLFNEHTLKDIRNGEKPSFFLKISYEFIESLNMKGSSMLQEQSVKLGEHCAALARPVSYVIKSYQKSEVGNLRRKITDIKNMLSFANDAMIALHRHNGDIAGNIRISTDALGIHSRKIHEIVKEMTTNKITFDKESFYSAFLNEYNKSLFHTEK